MSSEDYEIESFLLAIGIVSEEANDLGIEGSDSSPPEIQHLAKSCEAENSQQSGTQDENFVAVAHSLLSCETVDTGDSSSSKSGRSVFNSQLESQSSPSENQGNDNSHLPNCKLQTEHFRRKSFCRLSPSDQDRLEDSPIVDSESSPARSSKKSSKTQKVDEPVVDRSSVKHSNNTVPAVALDNSCCKSLVKSNEYKPGNDSSGNGFIDVNVDSMPSNSEIASHALNRSNESPASVASSPRTNSCGAQLSLTPVKVYRGSFGDYNEVSLLKRKEFHCSLSEVSRTNKNNATGSGSKMVSDNLKTVLECVNKNRSTYGSFRMKRVSSIKSVSNRNGTFDSELCDLHDSNYVEQNFGFGTESIVEDSKFGTDGGELDDLVRLPIKSIKMQNTEVELCVRETNILTSDRQSVSQEIPSNSPSITTSNKLTSKTNQSFVESFSEPSQHFNMSAIHKDIKLMRIKSEELPSFHSPSTPTSSRPNNATTTTSTPLKACRSIIALPRLQNTPPPPVTPIRSQRNTEAPSEYPLERLVRQDKANDAKLQGSSLCPNMSFVDPDLSISYSLALSNFSNLTNQSESSGSDDVQFVMDGEVIRRINFSDEVNETNSRDVANAILSRTLDSHEKKMCTLACQMAWELQEKVYDEIYERLSHMETNDEHYRIEATSRYKCIYVEKIERLWHFIVPLFDEQYWNRRSLKIVNKNLLIYGNRRLNAKQWEFANYNNCVFDVECVFNYGLYAFDTENPLFRKEVIHKFLVPNYNPEVSSEEVNK